ncbi:unnamed protein product, partial [marine sediment metagenome]
CMTESIWRMPRRWLHQLEDACIIIERLFGKAQDVEFTVDDGELWILQSRDLVIAK